ncbi:replication initiation protein [Vibrio parahaemolyticus]|uniref:replication initiation protein n=1 Tax=Vibrio parahaemolyticus TaxID=670 RepID=UPI000B51C101|nr:replication initiation protein [Vibrio parahaemolyticus]OWT85946.1 hypothetical protein BGM05_23090 [Vibrio parahaemolyticus]
MTKKEVVKKPHYTLAARMDYSGREQDLLTLMFRGVKREYDRAKFAAIAKGEAGNQVDISKLNNEFVFEREELIELFGLSKQGLYDALDSSTEGVMTKIISVKLPDSNRFSKHSICTDATFMDGQLTLTVNPKFMSYMVDYSQGFNEIDLKLLLSLDGKKGYDKRILEMISRFKGLRDYSLTLGEFCDVMGVSIDHYKHPSSLRASLLDGPIKKIVQKSDGFWAYRDGYPKGYDIKKFGRSYQKRDIVTFRLDYMEKTDPATLERNEFLRLYGVLCDFVEERLENPLPDGTLESYQLALTTVMKLGELPSEVVGGFGGAMELYALAKVRNDVVSDA